MSRPYISETVRQTIFIRAGYQCEYCHIHQDDTPFSHQIDHIVPLKHGGETVIENLALACIDCNRYKGSDLVAFDPDTGSLSLFFNPRSDVWEDQFIVIDALIMGQTAVARATVQLLRFNDPLRLMHRQALINARRYP